MSIKIMSHVWEHSQQKGSYLVTMLALADYAHDDGTRAYPSIATLARKTRMTERNVQLVLRKLEADGEILIHANAGPHGCNMFTILLNRPVISPPKKEGEKISGEQNMLGRGCKIPSQGGVEITPNPSLDPLKKDPGISSFSSSYASKRKEEDIAPDKSWQKRAVVLPASLRPDDLLDTSNLSPDAYTLLYEEAKAELIAEGVRDDFRKRFAIESRMTVILERRLKDHAEGCCDHPRVQGDWCCVCGVELSLTGQNAEEVLTS